VRNYCDALRQIASARGGEAGLAKIREERQRLLAAQAAAVERRNRAAAGELVEAAVVEAEWTAILRAVRAGMLALPSPRRRTARSLTASDVAAIDQEVREVLAEIGEAQEGSTP
jgi:phage terminase Nu1 subunit (DNA packaging protein)